MWPRGRYLIRELKKTTTATAKATSLKKGLMSRTMAVLLHCSVWYISLPSSAQQQQQRKMTKFCVVWRTWTTMGNFLILSLCPTFSFMIFLTVINEVNDYRVPRDSWVKYKIIFNWRCPRRARRGFLRSLICGSKGTCHWTGCGFPSLSSSAKKTFSLIFIIRRYYPSGPCTTGCQLAYMILFLTLSYWKVYYFKLNEGTLLNRSVFTQEVFNFQYSRSSDLILRFK